jgi:hypothetical protein
MAIVIQYEYMGETSPSPLSGAEELLDRFLLKIYLGLLCISKTPI